MTAVERTHCSLVRCQEVCDHKMTLGPKTLEAPGVWLSEGELLHGSLLLDGLPSQLRFPRLTRSTLTKPERLSTL